MHRIARTLLPLAIITTLTLGAFVTTALACGPPPAEHLVSLTVSNHLNAVKRGDAKTLERVWQPTALVTGVSAKGVTKVAKIAPSILKWTKTPDKAMTFKVGKIEVSGDVATAHLTLTWHGQKYNEVLTLAKDGPYTWKLSAKTHVAVGKPAPRKTRTAGAY